MISKVSKRAIISFCASILLCSLFIVITIINRSNIEKVTMEQLMTEKSIKVTEVISKLLYKTQILAALAIQTNGEINNFEQVAATIVDDPSILNVLIAPNGIVKYVYPIAGNEQVLGLDFYSEGAGNKEALLAKEKGQLVFGGPFDLVQGGRALVGRSPVYIDDSNGIRQFWGIVSVTLKYPQVLDGAGLSILETQGYVYEIWRMNPDTNEKQIIAKSQNAREKGMRYIQKHIPILNADWYFCIAPVHEWYQYIETWILSVIGLIMSLLIGFIVQNNQELKNVKTELEIMVHLDHLTGLINRKGLFLEVNNLISKNKKFWLHYIDIDQFKRINDTYGHSIGDLFLIQFKDVVLKHITNNHIFGRIGGDEFVLIHIVNDLHDVDEDAIWQKIEEDLAEPVYVTDFSKVLLTFSRGCARYPKDGYSIDELIVSADRKMYQHKKEKKIINRI